MAPRKEINVEIRKLIVEGRKSGESYGQLAKKYKISRNGVVRICKKFATTDAVENIAGRGRKRKTTSREDARIVREVMKNPSASARQVKQSVNINVSVKTIKRRIKDAGLQSFLKRKKPFISDRNKKKRLAFAKKYINKPLAFWENVVWSDESKFELFGSKRRGRVWRRRGEAFKPQMVHSTIKHGGGNVLVWGCFSKNGVGNLIRIEGKMTGVSYVEILRENLFISVEKMKLEHFIFQQDNDPKHTSRVAKNFIEENNIETLDWPPQSPDLNPIEHLWAHLDQKISREGVRNAASYFNNMVAAWEEISEEMIGSLIASIPRRLAAVIEAKGGHTKY